MTVPADRLSGAVDYARIVVAKVLEATVGWMHECAGAGASHSKADSGGRLANR